MANAAARANAVERSERVWFSNASECLKTRERGSEEAEKQRGKRSPMASLHSVSDSDLLSRMPALVLAERAAAAEVIAHLMEIDRRRLYLDQACSSLYRYCMHRLGYSEDEALRRVRVARLARKLPRVLEELRSGALHLTGLFLLSGYVTEHNAEALLAEARGQSRRELEKLLARWFPRPDAGTRIQPIMELSLLSPGFGSPGGHRPASSSAIGPSHSGTGRPTG